MERHLVACPFNALHLIPNSEKEKHVLNCIDKDRLLIKRTHCDQNCEVSVPIYENYASNPNDEDWDQETDIDILQPTFDIRKPLMTLDSIEKSIIDAKSQNCTTRSISLSSLSTLTEQKISRGRGQMLRIYGFIFKIFILIKYYFSKLRK